MKTFSEWALRCFDAGFKLLNDSFNQIAIIQLIQYLENDDSSSIISRCGLQILNEREKMLDLSKLENQLNKALVNETKESLNEWIANKRTRQFDELIKLLNGESEPSFYDCIIAVTRYNGSYLISSEPSLDDSFDGCNLDDNLTDKSNLPKEAGIYKCKIRYHAYKSHHPLDPVEWDVDVSIVSYEPVSI